MKLNNRNLLLRLSATTALALISLGSAALADIRTWDGAGTDNQWSTAANWNAAIADGDTVHFAGTTQLTANNDTAANSDYKITFNSGAGAFTLTGNAVDLLSNGAVTNNSVNNQNVNLGIRLLGDGTFTSATASDGLLTFGGPITEEGDALKTLSVNGNGDVTISGNITADSGDLQLIKAGTGTLTLSGVNSYDGTTLVNGGVLKLAHANALGSGNLVLNGGVLGLGGGDFTRALGTGAGQVRWTATPAGFAAFGANRSVNLGGSGVPMTWGSTSGFIANGDRLILGHSTADATITFQNAIDLNGAVRTVQVEDGSAAVDAALGGQLSGSGGLIKTGTGTLELAGNNSYTGATTISGGVMRLGHANALGSGNLDLNGGVLGLGAGDFTRAVGTGVDQVRWSGTSGGFAAFGANRNINLGGSGATVTWGATNFVQSGDSMILGHSTADATVNFQNPINFNVAVCMVQADDGSATVDAILSGQLSGTGGIHKTGDGVLMLAGNNSYTGITRVTSGLLRLDHANAMGAGNLDINGGVLGLGAGDFSRPLGTGPGEVRWSAASGGFAAFGANRSVTIGASGAILNWAGTNSFVGNDKTLNLGHSTANATVTFVNGINFNGGTRTIQVDDGSAAVDAVLSGQLSGTASSGLNKTGTGTLGLSQTNTYAGGTTISLGTLLANATNATGSGSVTVGYGATLGGTGSVVPTGSNGINVSGALAPGNGVGSIGNLTVNLGSTTGVVTLAGGATLNYELGTAGETLASPGSSDLLILAGAAANDFVFGDNVIDFLNTGAVGFYKLFDTDNAATWSGLTYNESTGEVTSGLSTANLAPGLAGTLVIGNSGNGGNAGDIYLQVVPEPSAALLGGLGLLALLRRRNRK